MNVKETMDVSMCLDCAMWHANGELPDTTDTARCDEITKPSGLTDSDTGEMYSCYVVVTGGESFFSWSACDLCEQHHGEHHFVMGGERVDGVVILD